MPARRDGAEALLARPLEGARHARCPLGVVGGRDEARVGHPQGREHALVDERVDVLPRHFLGGQRQEAVVVVALCDGMCEA